MNKFPVFSTNKYSKKFVRGKRLGDNEIAEIADLLLRNLSQREIQSRTGRSLGAIQNVRGKLLRGENIYKQNRRPVRSGRFTHPQDLDFIFTLLFNYPMATVSELCRAYFLAFGLRISHSMMRFIIHHHLNIHRRKIDRLEWARTKRMVKFAHDKYKMEIMPKLAENMKKLVFIDESHFVSNDLFRTHMWVCAGAMPLAFSQKLWQKKSLSLIQAIGWDGGLMSMVKPHFLSNGVKDKEFALFLLKLHVALPIDHILLMDNAKIHKSWLVKCIVEGCVADGRTVCYTAKYSPELNPIELVFGVMKPKLKSGPQMPRNLVEAVKDLSLRIDKDWCRNTIRRIFGFYA